MFTKKQVTELDTKRLVEVFNENIGDEGQIKRFKNREDGEARVLALLKEKGLLTSAKAAKAATTGEGAEGAETKRGRATADFTVISLPLDEEGKSETGYRLQASSTRAQVDAEIRKHKKGITRSALKEVFGDAFNVDGALGHCIRLSFAKVVE